MSYAMVSQSPGVGIEWHQVLERELGDAPVEELVATYAGTGPDGLCVISVWASKAHADRFTVEQLVPALERLGVARDQQARRSVLEIDLVDLQDVPAHSARRGGARGTRSRTCGAPSPATGR